MVILGINSYHPDSSAAVIVDGKPIAVSEEERFCRIKHFAGFPRESIKYCLKEAGVSVKNVDYIAIPKKPLARLRKKIIYGIKVPYLAQRRLSAWGRTFRIKKELSELFGVSEKEIKAKIVKVEHHSAHLASSFFVSGFDKAFLFSADALGDFASTMWGVGEGNKMRILGEITFPHSLGFYYTAITQYLGFLDFGDEYKAMGLAAYGQPEFETEFKKILKHKTHGFELGLDYFLHHRKHINMNFERGHPNVGLMFSSHLEKKLGHRRQPDEPIEKRHENIAFCLQKRLEETLIHLVNTFSPENIPNLCLSGGVSHNSAANGKLLYKSRFKKIYVPPAPGDAGLAVGAAFYLCHQIFGKPRTFEMKHAYWGPGYDAAEIKAEIETKNNDLVRIGCVRECIETDDELCRKVAKEIASGKIVGWFQGRMELGPRALGQRSILADPRKENVKDILNKKIKQREEFRPFALSILKEKTKNFFEAPHQSPFMSFVSQIKKEKKDTIPAACHVDRTCRVQTVEEKTSPLYRRLISEFEKITGVPALINTSFNENEPIVCSPEEAINCFLRTEMDTLALGNVIIKK